MEQTDIIPASKAHITSVAESCRMEARREIEEGSGRTLESCLAIMQRSGRVKALLVNGEPLAVFGVIQASALDGTAEHWMLCSERVRHHARTFMREARKELDRLLEQYGALQNYIDVRDTQAIRFLEKLGFTVYRDAPVPMGNITAYLYRKDVI